MSRFSFYATAASAMLAVLALPVAAMSNPAAKPAPKPAASQSCIDIARIDHSQILDDSTILFHMLGGKTYENKLPYRCFGLKFENGFAYATSISQLCNTDIIHVLHRGTACGLGMFTPYVKPAKANKPNNYWAKPN